MCQKKQRRLFLSFGGQRQSLRLGKMGDFVFLTIKENLLELARRKSNGLDAGNELMAWLKKIDIKLHKKLVRIKLLKDVKPPLTLEALVADFLNAKKSWAKSTRVTVDVCVKRILAILSSKKQLVSFTQGDADNFEDALKISYPNISTRSKTISIAKQIFKHATRNNLINFDPFSHLKKSSMVNSSRSFYVPANTILLILGHIPNNNSDLKTILILTRFAGCRCPSEVLDLKWSDIDFANKKLNLPSPKTKHCGKALRIVPLFPELFQHLQSLYQARGTNSEFLLQNRNAHKNWRTCFAKLLKKLKIAIWPRLFQNLRASMENDLLNNGVPLHVAAKILGHSVKVQAEHYINVTESEVMKVQGITFT